MSSSWLGCLTLNRVNVGSNPTMPSMKKYKIIGKIVLSFIFDDEQRDFLLEPNENQHLESNGATVWLIEKGKKYESITTANVIDVALKRNDIEEILIKTCIIRLFSYICKHISIYSFKTNN